MMGLDDLAKSCSLYCILETTPLLLIPKIKPYIHGANLWFNTPKIPSLEQNEQMSGEKFRNMIITLSENLTLKDGKKIEFLQSPSSTKRMITLYLEEHIQEDPDIPLYILSWLEAGRFITPWNVDTLKFILENIDRLDLLPIVTDFTNSEEHKDACEKTGDAKVNKGVQSTVAR